MKCPLDGTQMLVADRGGVEIDHCPKCRGVWLDRGELDKILAISQKASEHENWSRQVDAKRDQAGNDRHKAEVHPVSDFLTGFFTF